MKNMFRAFMLISVLCLASPGPAAAAEIGDVAFHPYMGLGLGVYNLKFTQPGFSQNNNVFGGYLQLGSDFNDYLGAELRIGTTAKGSSSYTGGSVDLTTDYLFSYLLKLQYPTTPDLRIYGLVGGTTGKAKITPTPAGFLSASAGKTATGVSFGAGLDYRLNDQLRAGVEWLRYWNDVNVSSAGFPANKMTIDGYTATLKYLF